MKTKSFIPIDGSYEVTIKLASIYNGLYRKYFAKDYKRGPSQKRYELKLAARSLMKDNFNRGATFSTLKSGMVYLITNKAFPGYAKVGMTIDIDSRLSSYQTYDPHRSYIVKHYVFVEDRSLAEKKILNSFGVSLESGEWIKDISLDKFLDILYIDHNGQLLY